MRSHQVAHCAGDGCLPCYVAHATGANARYREHDTLEALKARHGILSPTALSTPNPLTFCDTDLSQATQPLEEHLIRGFLVHKTRRLLS